MVATHRDRVIVSACVVLLTALAWAYLIRLDREMAPMIEHDRMMADMGMSMDMPWGAPEVLLTFVMWSVMMVGMMTPSAAPMILLFAATARGRGRDTTRVLAFGAGYLLVWIGFSAAAALLQWALHEAAALSPAMSAASPALGGAILVTAGVYQLTPIKGACLTHCRSPLGFLMSHWRDGTAGALRMGIVHGAYCVGCCWALMAILFAVGVMNLVWVAALTTFVLVEKLGPGCSWVTRAGGVAAMAAGVTTWLRG